MLLLVTNVLLAVLIFVLGLADEMVAAGPATASMPDVPQWILGLANGGLILILYGLMGALGFVISQRSGLPGIYREGSSMRELLMLPLIIGSLMGGFLIVLDRAFAINTQFDGLAHPAFPASLLASATAGIGEEIIFRLFLLSLWVFMLGLIFKRPELETFKFWIANLIAAAAFAAAHLPAVMFMIGARNLGEIPSAVIAEVMILNLSFALVAGERYIKYGLIAAVGVHFWTDIIWHVVYPLLLS
jgi:membrane protease YdiL (CAAX protease family)